MTHNAKKQFYMSVFLRFVRGFVAGFLSVPSILLPLGVAFDPTLIFISLGIGFLSGLLLACEKGVRSYEWFKSLKA